VKTIWTGRLTEAAAKYGDHAPMAATCCNACRACVTTNVAALAVAGAAGIAAYGGRFVRRLTVRPAKPS
jgi:NAD/NADP transhydrogenase alpha subunit